MNEYKERYESYNGLIISPYDNRDYKFKLLVPLGAFNIPEEYESPVFPFVYDLGNTQMCVACSYSAVRYLLESSHEQSELKEPFSPTWHYGNRYENEVFEGMFLRSCCKKGREGSILLRDLDEFCSTLRAISLVEQNKEDYLKKAEPFKIDSFYTCGSRIEVQLAIIATKAVIVGIPLYNCIFSIPKSGVVLYEASKNIHSSGGHAVTLTGWKMIDNLLHWRVLNSWGKSWGDNGYCWLPETYPWIELAYVLVDNTDKIKYLNYITEFYNNKK